MSFADVTLKLLDASKYTIGIFFLTLLIAIPLGIVISACALSKFKPSERQSTDFHSSLTPD